MIETQRGTIELKGANIARCMQIGSNLQGFHEATVGHDLAKGRPLSRPLSNQRATIAKSIQFVFNLEGFHEAMIEPKGATIEPKGATIAKSVPWARFARSSSGHWKPGLPEVPKHPTETFG